MLACVQRNDVLIEAGEARLMFLDDLWLEGPVTIPPYFKWHSAKAALERLGRLAMTLLAFVSC